MSSWVTILAGLLFVAYLFNSLLISKYRKKHGFRSPPGPWGLPILGHLHLLGNHPSSALQKLANKFGPIMYIRLGLFPTIVVSSPEIAELIFKTHDVNFASRPKAQAAEYISYGQRGLVFAEYGSRWRSIRKLCTSQLLSNTKIESMKYRRKEDMTGFVRWLVDAAEAGAVVDLSAKVGSLIQDMTLGMVIGRARNDSFDFKSSVEKIMRLAGAVNLADFVPFVGVLDLQGLGLRMKNVSKVVDGFLEEIIDQHIRDGDRQDEHQMDFIDVMLSSKESIDAQELDRTTIKAIVLDMIAGAMDTSFTAIEWTLSEIFKHPRVMKLLQSELENVVGMDRMVEESDFPKLEYLDLVVKESLRLHPVAPLLVHESTEDVTIGGYYIPKKSRIIVNIWAIGRDPKVWSDNANEFYPERFSGMNLDFRGHDLRFLPFGSGRRSCPGIQLGLTTVRLIVAQLLHCFNWELPNGMTSELDMTDKPGLTMPRAKNLLANPNFRLPIPKL